MSEVYKITNMLVTDEDIKHIDKNWQSIIDEYTKILVREKDLVIAQYLMRKQKDEIERLNNIIKEVREYIETKEKDDDNWVDYELLIEPIRIKEILDRGSDE